MFHIFPLGVSEFMESRVGPNMTEVRVLVQFRMFRVQHWLFEVISKWFCMVLRRGVQKAWLFNWKTMFFEFLGANPCRTIMKLHQNLVLDPKRARLDQNSDFGHVWTYFCQSRRTSPCQQSRFLFLFFSEITPFQLLFTNLLFFIKS